MEILFYIAVFVAGAFIGSFLNVIADRYQTKESFFWGRSHCDFCKTTLVARDLVPVFSFIFSGGRCRYCCKKLSGYYLISEILTGSLFVLLAYYTKVFVFSTVPSWITFGYFAVILSLYISIFLSDMKYRVIPNKVVFFGIAFVLVFMISTIIYGAYSSYNKLIADDFGKYLIESGYLTSVYMGVLKSFGGRLLSAFCISLFFILLIIITRGRGMGWGDVKLAFLIGIINGYPHNIVAIFLGFLSGALYSVVMVLMKKKTVKDTVPFGPFLILGSIVAQVYGISLLDWYLALF
jgi:prepilin signal peptidase PulO-like enzyme (type II secretory pathway)